MREGAHCDVFVVMTSPVVCSRSGGGDLCAVVCRRGGLRVKSSRGSMVALRSFSEGLEDKVVVIGGGIGGLATSIALTKIGVDNVVLEKAAGAWSCQVYADSITFSRVFRQEDPAHERRTKGARSVHISSDERVESPQDIGRGSRRERGLRSVRKPGSMRLKGYKDEDSVFQGLPGGATRVPRREKEGADRNPARSMLPKR